MKQRTNKFTDQELIAAYNELKHLGKIAHKLKIPVVQVWRHCRVLGLEFKNGGWNNKIPLEEILAGEHGYYPTSKLNKRVVKEGILPYICEECGVDKWNDKPLTLQLDHKNGDSSDHRLENLRLLCPNCHSQTDTWCGRNKK